MSEQPSRASHRSGMWPTRNAMGWTSDVLNEISREFVRYSKHCLYPVLDVGAAYGVATIPALEQGANVHANDLSPEHLQELDRRTPAHLRARLTTVAGRLPTDLQFPDESFDAIHASQVLHFLTPEQLVAAMHLMHRWLRPGGRLFLLTGTPYMALYTSFLPVFLERKANGMSWPGYVDDLRDYTDHWAADLLPNSIHLMDDEILVDVVVRAGFLVEQERMFSRTGLPDFCRYDGRENLGLIARKPIPGGADRTP